ncbi:ABC transporter substrate-binding protein [Solidesulfovibrio carbinolicus]|uniref:ABC transporter substrate-binding protein n=1 Tax=Solidesulfovibrio carbinolicus TaxID=296842 RepID=A0A4P6HHN4_9BACT|nr:ABC transporter substrate-binding protein [Solidesulfovibrio carbinolicus]QAZ66285.1 ABC transporter substrate-binding protein [Solidesulfovibrio carbinolicus]
MAKFLLLVAALLLCPAAVHAAAPAGEPIVVGGLFAQSGPAAVVGTPSKLVAEMTVKQINDMGGILGRPVKLVAYDTESSPDVALRQARQLVEGDKVLAIIGPTSTGEGLAVKKYTEEKHVPVIMTVGGDAVVAGGKFGPYDWTFKAPQRTATAVAKIYDYLKGKNISKIAVLSSKDAFGQDGLTELKDNAAKYGIEIIAEETFDPKGTDFSAQAFKLQAAKPQAAVVWTIGPAGSIAAKNFAALPGERPLLVQCHGQPGPTYLELAGEAAGGTVMPGTKLMAPESLPDEDPQKIVIEAFIKAYKDNGIQEKFPLNTHSGYAYDALTLLRAGLEKAGKAEPEALRAALEKLERVVGVSGVYTMSSQDHNGLGPDSMVMLIVDSNRYKLAP